MSDSVLVRPATAADAGPVAAVMNAVITEGGLTIFDQAFSEADEAAFIASLGPRSLLRVAELGGAIVGVQSVDLFSPVASLAHVATMGTWIRAEARGHGIGRRLMTESLAFAHKQGYRKIVIQVLAGNHRALRFYRSLGFLDIGVARAHVKLDDRFHDEVYLERLLVAQ
jgi:L-amino acid N-acyltransferase YncA